MSTSPDPKSIAVLSKQHSKEIFMSKPVLVVIGTGGMGAAIARRLGFGRTVVLADFDEAKLKTLTASLQGDGYEVVSQTVNVSDRASVASLANAAAMLGPVTGVAHTAGVSPQQAPVSAVLAVDLLGTAIVLDEFERVMAEGGAAVVISSMGGHMGTYPAELEQALASTPTDALLSLPFLSAEVLTNAGAAYSIAKRANQLRVQATAPLWGARGARVNSISPGIISTPMGQLELAGPTGEGMRAMLDASAAKRLGTPEDIANAAEFLLDPRSSFITGTDLLVDGGVIAALRSGRLTLPQG
jgi:NAD(P)-dependent dehydrogenase (short-subunit alcohol dehydrogenase family)